MTKQTALASATRKPADPEAWVAEKPKAAAPVAAKPARLVVELPPDLHRQLKCGMEGRKIKDVIQDLLQQYLAGSVKAS